MSAVGAAAAMALTMGAGTVFAATPTGGSTVDTTAATIDYTKTASLTLRKLKETNGDEKAAYGVDVTEDDARTPMEGVQFGIVRVGDIETVAGNIGNTPQVGTYYTNIDPNFLAILTKLGAAPTVTTITKSDNTTITAYTSEALTEAMSKATANNSLTETGDEMINDYVRAKGAASLAETDADGYVTFADQTLGLYVTAETSTRGYLEKVTDPESNSLPSSAELITSPSDPFLVSLPQTNRVTLSDQDAGSVWQYDVTAYPKNTTAQIRKTIRREGTTDLVETDDAEIGETVNEFITANLDSPLSDHTYETLKIDDAMNNMALRKINAVYMTDYVKDPSSTEQFGEHHLEFKEGTDYTVTYSTQAGRMNASDDDDKGLGDTTDLTTKTAYKDRDITRPDDIPSSLPDAHAEDTAFQIQFTESGLRKINAWFASEKSTVSDHNGDETVAGNITTGQAARQMIVVDFDATVTPALSDVSSTGSANSERNAQINGENGITAADNEDRPGLTVRFSNTSNSQYVPGNRIHVYTYRLDLTKDGVTDASQVSFTVLRKSDGQPVQFVKELDGQYHVLDSEGYKKEDGTADAEDAANAVTTIHPATGSSGKLIVRGLDTDTYTFTETTTQNGRSLLTDTFDVTLSGHTDDSNLDDVNGDLTAAYITAPSADGTDTGRQTGATDIDKQAGVASFTVNNYPTIDLKTGGIGQNVLMLFGIGVAGLAGIVTVTTKQKKAKEKA